MKYIAKSLPKKGKLKNGDLFGFFEQEIALVLDSENWESKFEEIMYLNQLTQFDDMTLLLLKG